MQKKQNFIKYVIPILVVLAVVAVVVWLFASRSGRPEAVETECAPELRDINHAEETQSVVDTSEKTEPQVVLPSKKSDGLELNDDEVPPAVERRAQKNVYTTEQLAGEWVCGSRHERYETDGTGLKWDTADDVQKVEGQPFAWTLSENRLEALYPMTSVGGVVPVHRQVVYVDDATMVQRDDYGTIYQYNRVEQTLNLTEN